MSLRPSLFEEMGSQFAEAFGNCDCIFEVNGVALVSVRGILRKWRELGQSEEGGQDVEGTTHSLSVAAVSVPGLVSQRDSVTIFLTDDAGIRIDSGTLFQIKNHADDARAMLRIYLAGDI